jgi:hypothetical protein
MTNLKTCRHETNEAEELVVDFKRKHRIFCHDCTLATAPKDNLEEAAGAWGILVWGDDYDGN